MKVLAVADEESKALWDYFDKSTLEGIDMIISCGDLDPQYLSFLATFFHGPVLYVHGNHDDNYRKVPPEGCICIEDDIFVYRGIRFLGLGGSMRYKPGIHQYTQAEMKNRIRKIWLKLKRHKGFDVLVAHAPAFRINDSDKLPHTGFQAFLQLMDKYSPLFFVHGHVHLNYNGKARRLDEYKNTVIINAYEKYIFEIPEKQ
ncbi:metallophosphoesterase [Lachnospiraceae bacterium 62-35]